MSSDDFGIQLRGVETLRDVHRVETVLVDKMRCLVLSIADRLTKLCSQLRILDRDRLIDRGVTGDIRRIVRQGAQREGILVDILIFEQKLADKVPAANVMHQVAEIPTAEGIVAEIL